ncbi:COQ9 family protein [Anaplasma platys]|uniref:COQ9 family protein n=1 Tax=Anaplasma platys TaxID=949 RepID=A0A858PZ18_9RICK|nr:COQ9 family protein [Anaplasma platys]QJC27804.1 COQ9 family protein [Anaplasma platys]
MDSKNLKHVLTTNHLACEQDVKIISVETIGLIPQYGVTDKALLEACSRLNMDGYLYKFPDGIRNVLEFMHKDLLSYLTASYENLDTCKVPRIRDKISWLLKMCVRYHAAQPAPQQLLKAVTRYNLQPANMRFSAFRAFEVADTMWHLINDTSTTFSYYTKRTTLSTIYALTLLHMSKDYSENFVDTFSFIERRVDNVISFHKIKNKMGAAAKKGLKLFDVKFDL